MSEFFKSLIFSVFSNFTTDDHKRRSTIIVQGYSCLVLRLECSRFNSDILIYILVENIRVMLSYIALGKNKQKPKILEMNIESVSLYKPCYEIPFATL